jgi:hypothetical protein
MCILENGKTEVDCIDEGIRFEVWSTITEHISNIFVEGELVEKVVCRNIRLTTHHGAIEGKTQEKALDLYATATAVKNNTNSILIMANSTHLE